MQNIIVKFQCGIGRKGIGIGAHAAHDSAIVIVGDGQGTGTGNFPTIKRYDVGELTSGYVVGAATNYFGVGLIDVSGTKHNLKNIVGVLVGNISISTGFVGSF